MLCEECHANEANFTVSVVAGEETSVRHLCADCMSRMNADLMKGGMNKLINTVLSAISATGGGQNRKEFSMPIFGRFTHPCPADRRRPATALRRDGTYPAGPAESQRLGSEGRERKDEL